jgi:hypothetical protein
MSETCKSTTGALKILKRWRKRGAYQWPGSLCNLSLNSIREGVDGCSLHCACPIPLTPTILLDTTGFFELILAGNERMVTSSASNSKQHQVLGENHKSLPHCKCFLAPINFSILVAANWAA